jgi:DNA-binding CsgD family transcriptional regulator/tetratricopeptide (TPR) repeat protein
MPPTALLERDEQLGRLRSLLTHAASGRGAMVFVGGEAGIGKSALVRRFCEDVSSTARVLVGGCDAMQTPRPLGPLLDMASALGPPFATMLDDDGARARVFGHLLDAFSARATVAVFEDVHWADDATLDLLRFLGRRLGGTRALVIATYRHDELGPRRHPLRAVLGDLASSRDVTRMSIPPLSRDAVARLARDSGVDPDELHRLTAGNPFFVTEVVAAGGDRLPTSVSDAVGARVGRLPEPARTALEAASVIGPTVAPDLLTALGCAADAIEACLAGGLLHEQGGRLAFRHELAREAVVGTVSAPRRRALHAAVLAALEGARVTGTDHATLAHHAAEAGDADAVLRHAPVAARAAAALGAHREARAQFARALPYLDRLPDDDHTDLLEAYARECDTVGRHAESRAAWSAAIERLRAAGHTERWADAHTDLARACFSLGDNAAAEAASSRAIEVLEGLHPGAALARAYQYRAALRMLDRDTEAAIDWGTRTIELATAIGDHRVLAGTHVTVAASLMLQDQPTYVDHFARAIALAQEHGLHVVHANAHLNRGSGAGELHRFAEAEHHLRQALGIAEGHDLDSQASYALAWLALTRLYRGDWTEAETLTGRTLGRSSASTITRIMALVALGRLRVRRGDPEAWPALDEALELALGTGTLQRLAPVHAARAEAAWYDGDLDRVRAEAAASFTLALQARHPWFVGELGYWRSLAGDVVELPAFAAEPFALQVSGRLEDAAAAWTALGCPFEAARASADSPAEHDVRQAVAAFARMGARVAAEHARARLRELGATRIPQGPRARTQRHPAGLTPREAEVLARLVEGLSNAEIAQRHRVSPRTVEHQVSAVLGKLGVDSRAAAIAEAHRRGLVTPT